MSSRWFHHTVDGEAADVARLAQLATYNFGHFTSMQVRGGCVLGLHLHCDRLDNASRELFGRRLDPQRVLKVLHRSLTGLQDASVRLTVYPAEGGTELHLLASVGPPQPSDVAALKVHSVQYERYLPHIKHVATLPLLDLQRRARLAGFDDAIFVDATGRISEGTIWNVGFYDGDEVTWPNAPQLSGITMQLVQAGLAKLGVRQSVRAVTIDDLTSFRSAFTTFSLGAGRLLACIDARSFIIDEQLSQLIGRAYELNVPERLEAT